jgi:hypothetical protein
MILDDREAYMSLQKDLRRLPIEKLKNKVNDLHRKVFYEHDIQHHSEFRLASAVLLDRTKTGESLIYHLQNLCCFVLVFFVSLLYNK